MTLKMILLWMFIGFGFLTFLMHLFGSPISILLGKFFRSSSEDQQTSQEYTDAELKERRQRALQMKQFLQDNKVDIYRENILEPREEILMAKREEEFYKFDSRWRGRGQRLGRRHVEEQAEDDFLSQEFLLHEDPSSEELGTDTEESPRNDDTSNITEFGTDHKCMSRKEENETNSVRQRRHSQSCEVIYVFIVSNIPHEEE
ncbi:uncharacterized protein LOC111345340 isoform X2 [Stylophora pistillata]|uniref:uncharacterized protein LOC111345340 isoform X2 n=1 Tax=Stylophora pistillata TaxID=50429 RepID=UPI000C051F03|nr:uncharacterized protein LOC111345340 isoform X2 [Stylophora pistillata]